MTPVIRPARPDDRAALSEICVLTADSGQDASALYSDPDYPGLVWSVPYLFFAPNHAFVLENEGKVVGYVVGAADTEAYEAQLERDWWPELARTYAGRKPEAKLDANVLDKLTKPPKSDATIVRDYPAHMHINLLPEVQSGGWGRKMIETEMDSLRAAGVPGMHLGLGLRNERAFGFYQRVGLSELRRDDAIWMGIRF